MPDLLTPAVAKPRFSSLLLSLFAALALLLAFVGLYGVMAHGVTQRTREIGIRMAVGAKRSNVLAMIIRQGMRPVLFGVAIGLFTVAFTACYIPARRRCASNKGKRGRIFSLAFPLPKAR